MRESWAQTMSKLPYRNDAPRVLTPLTPVSQWKHRTIAALSGALAAAAFALSSSHLALMGPQSGFRASNVASVIKLSYFSGR